MIDLHMHILPGIDDGAESFEEALEMAHMAAESDAEGIVATSHGNIGELSAEEYFEAFNRFDEKLKENNVPLVLYPGMEIFMGQGVDKKLSRGELFTVNNTKYVLTEFDFYEDIWRVNFYLELLSDDGYIPIIAHPERYSFIQENPQEVFYWAERGYVTQVNKGVFSARLADASRKRLCLFCGIILSM